MRCTVLISVLTGAGAILSFGQSYNFIRIADDTTPRPDGKGTFLFSGGVRPAMDGTKVVFQNAGNDPSLWRFDIATNAFVKLADFSTAVPGGRGNFSSFSPQDTQPLIKSNSVVFLGWDSSGQRFSQGLYRVGADGGPVSRIVSYGMANPSGGTFRRIDESSKFIGAFSHDGVKVAFPADNEQGLAGLYTANLDGSGLTLIADANTKLTNLGAGVNIWALPSIQGNTLGFYGQDGFDPSSGYNGIFTAPVTGGGVNSITEVFNSKTQLPGNPNANFHARITAPMVAMENGTYVFSADDSNAPRGFKGLYVKSGALTKIADNLSTLAGIGEVLVPSSFNSFSLNQGRVLFRAQDFTPGRSALYLWQNGTVTRVVGTGDRIDGETVRSVLDISPGALSGDRFTFTVDMGFRYVIYTGVPAGGISITGVQNGASYRSNIVAPGSVVTIYGTGMGPDTLATFQFDASSRIPTVLAGARVLFNGVPAPILYASAGQTSVIAPFSLDGKTEVQVVAQYQGRSSTPLTVPVAEADPGLFSENRQGTGQGAILNQDGSYNSAAAPAAPGSVVVLFGAGFGQTFPLSVEGTITSAATPPQLRQRPTVTIGGLPATVDYAGPAPGAVVGLYQFNIRIPAGATAGNQPVKITVGSFSTQDGLTVAVR